MIDERQKIKHFFVKDKKQLLDLKSTVKEKVTEGNLNLKHLTSRHIHLRNEKNVKLIRT